MPIRFLPLMSGCLLLLIAGGVKAGDEKKWGTVKGRFVLDGNAESGTPLSITRDEEFCGTHNLKDESLILNKSNGGVQNVVVWLYSREPVPVHPKLDENAKPARLDNRNCRFSPRIVPVRTGQTLEAINSDPVAHNVTIYGRRNQPFAVIVPENEPLRRSFEREEILPIRVDCSIHAWMRSYLVITDHPYSVVSDKDGRFELRHVPQGDWKFKFWHERPGYLSKMVGADVYELSRGVLTLTVGEENDLGTLKLAAKDFAADD